MATAKTKTAGRKLLKKCKNIKGNVGDGSVTILNAKIFYPKLNEMTLVTDYKTKAVLKDGNGVDRKRYEAVVAVEKGTDTNNFLFYLENILKAGGWGFKKSNSVFAKQIKDGDALKEDASGEETDEYKMDGAQGYVYFNVSSNKPILAYQNGVRLDDQAELVCGHEATAHVKLNIVKFKDKSFDSFGIYLAVINVVEEGQVFGSNSISEEEEEFMGVTTGGDDEEIDDFLASGDTESSDSDDEEEADEFEDDEEDYEEEDLTFEADDEDYEVEARPTTTRAKSSASKAKAKAKASAKAKVKSSTVKKKTKVGDQDAFAFNQ